MASKKGQVAERVLEMLMLLEVIPKSVLASGNAQDQGDRAVKLMLQLVTQGAALGELVAMTAAGRSEDGTEFEMSPEWRAMAETLLASGPLGSEMRFSAAPQRPVVVEQRPRYLH